MSYKELESLSGGELKRLCGVSRKTFSAMVAIVRPALDRRGCRGGQAKLSVEDQLLISNTTLDMDSTISPLHC